MRGGLRGRLKKIGGSIRDFGERAAPIARKGLQYGAVAAAAVGTAAKIAHDVHRAYHQPQHLGGQPRSATIDHVISGLERYTGNQGGGTTPPHGRGWEMADNGRWTRRGR